MLACFRPAATRPEHWLTVFWAVKLHVEFADVVLHQLHFPVAHHPASSIPQHTEHSPFTFAPPALGFGDQGCPAGALRAAPSHNFMTSISRRLLGDAMVARAQAPGAREEEGGELAPRAGDRKRRGDALRQATCATPHWAGGEGSERGRVYMCSKVGAAQQPVQRRNAFLWHLHPQAQQGFLCVLTWQRR